MDRRLRLFWLGEWMYSGDVWALLAYPAPGEVTDEEDDIILLLGSSWLSSGKACWIELVRRVLVVRARVLCCLPKQQK